MPKGVAVSPEVKARAVLRVIAGESTQKVANSLGLANHTVWRWRNELSEAEAADVTKQYEEKAEPSKACDLNDGSPKGWMFKSQNTYYKIARRRVFRWACDEWRSSTIGSRELRGMEKNTRLA